MQKNAKNIHQHKARHGHHQKRTHKFLKVYTPYLPLALFVAMSILLGIHTKTAQRTAIFTSNSSQPRVLSYATEMNIAGLLSATNEKRINNGVAPLSLNNKLSSAAQAKANDMVARNYWSHNTPDGSPPWIFITNAGYSYSTAGENLAYGQNTSTEVITQWYGSQTHKDNLINKGFTEVGFGVANAVNYLGNGLDNSQSVGQQTIIVAMYASPYSITPQSSTAPTVKPTETKSSNPISQKVTETTPVPPAEVQQTADDNNVKSDVVRTSLADDPSQPIDISPSKNISAVESMTQSRLSWITSLLIMASSILGLFVISKHSFALHKFLVKGERYVLQHKLLDMTVVSLILLTYIATRTVSVIL